MKKTLTFLSGSFGITGIVMFFYHSFLFSNYAKHGAVKLNNIYIKLINNHGDYSYITLDQSNTLNNLLIWPVILILLAIVLDVIKKRL